VLPAADHADLPHSALDLGRPVGNEAVLAVERLCTRVRVGDPQRHRLLRIDDRLQQRRSSTCAVVGGIYIEHIQLPRPRRSGIQGRARHGDPDQLAVPFGDSHAILAIALVGQRGSPKPLPNGQEAWVVEHCVRHQSPIRLLSAPHMHARHLHDIPDPSRANSQRRAHRRIVGRHPQHLPHRYKSQAEQSRSAGTHPASRATRPATWA